MHLFRKKKKKSDHELARLIVLNNEKAFAEFIKRYESPLFSFCLGFLKDHSEAEDIVQESFLKLYKYIELIDPDKNIKTFLFKIARNLCLDNLKKKKPFYFNSLPEKESNDTPFDQYCKSQEEKFLYAAIDNLKEDEKTAILLKYISGMKYSEISEILNKSQSAVDSILVRAKKKLKKKLQTISG